MRREQAALAFDEREGRRDGAAIVSSLSDGLTLLRNLLFLRIHEDVEKKIGTDSMLLAVSPLKSERSAKLEIELFEIAEATAQVAERNYVRDPEWFQAWISSMRLGDYAENSQARHRIGRYLEKNADQRRLAFSAHLEQAFAEAHQAPLILYRLFPLSVGVCLALAFGAPLDANELRNRQMFWLPAIQDCHECHGAPLENGEQCRICGNPVWTYRWLTIAE